MPKKLSTKKKEGKKDVPRLVLLDSHAILHRAFHALPEFSSPSGEPTGALYGLVAMLLKIINDLKPDYIVAAFDLPKPTYRHEAYDGYKAKRPELDENLGKQIERSRDVLAAFNIPIYEKEGFEADDVLGTIAKTISKKEADIIIASGDMDTLQLVDDEHVRVFTLKKGIQDTILYSEKDVVERFGFGPELLPDFKGLRGDPSDNIPGIKGIGEKTATTLITTFGGIDDIYKKLKKTPAAFTKAGITPRIMKLLEEGKEEAEFSKLLATIRRDVPITFTLPKEPWREGLVPEQVEKLFGELGFRTLLSRFKEQFSVADAPKQEALIEESMSAEDRATLRVALWVVHSDLTNPSDEDVLAYTNTQSLEDAQKKIFAELKEKKLEQVFETIEKPLIPIVSEMTRRGVALDVPYLEDLSETYHRELRALEQKIWNRADEHFNINSPKQLGDVLFEKLGLSGAKKTATGQRSTREEELLKMKDKHPIIREILEYRELQKLLSTYIDAFAKMVGADGRLHATFVQTGAATGRMSSQNPNLQNIPIRTELGRAVRGAFVAEKGFSFVACDYSQIELRIAAILSGDEKMVETFVSGGDIHTRVAAEIFDVAENEVTPDMRRTAKVINFGIIYGMGSNALAHTADMPRSKAQEYLAEYQKTFTGLSEYIEKEKNETRRRGFTETLFGRRRYLPGITSSLPYIRAEAERQAINAPIQGTSADIIKLAMIRIDAYLKEKKMTDVVRLVLQIHDELVYEVRDDLVEKLVPEIRTQMEEGITGKDTRGVPIIVDASVGKRWSDMKRIGS